MGVDGEFFSGVLVERISGVPVFMNTVGGVALFSWGLEPDAVQPVIMAMNTSKSMKGWALDIIDMAILLQNGLKRIYPTNQK